MKAINILIKIKRKELDEIRLVVAELEDKRIFFVKALEIVKSDLLREESFVRNNPDLNFAFLSFYQKCKVTIDNLLIKITSLDTEIAKHREIIFALFAELKRFEIVKNEHLKSEKEQENKIEIKYFEEIAINSFNKKMKEDKD